MKAFLAAAFVILVTPALCQKITRKPIAVMPKLVIYDVNGKATNLNALGKDKVTFVDFWFVPCGPCFLEMSMLHKLYDEYKHNPNVEFLTITFSDNAQVKPLIENRNTSTNRIYSYFKSLAQLDTFKLPVYFLNGKTSSKKAFLDAKIYPENIFGFSGYPTIFIFDKKGKMIYSKTAFVKSNENQQKRDIEHFINSKL